ncbi:MAG: hypothetical protein KIS67_16605 [Verrucomicrobiae bacterium]|nr:hypothetical protein [Verrucomicrobiae bacterium]
MWSKVSWAANPLGVLEPQTNSYTELATGLHYRDPSSGEWRESDPSFELNEEGYAVAAKCQHQVIIAPSLNPADGVVVDLQTPEGRRLRSGLLGLNLFDPVSGKSLQIAAVRDVAGTQISDTEIVWFDAFEGLQADVRVRNERGAFHQDVLLRERLSAEQLQRLGFDAATVRLEVWTEFVGSPEPALERKVMDAGTNGTFGAAGPAAATDERVDFGVMRMEWGSGKAFAEPGAGSTIRIFKEWQKLEGRQFLIESASYGELMPLLESLPVKTAALDAPAPAARVAWHRAPPARPASGRITEAQSIQMAQLKPPSRSGVVVLDYVILNSGITDYTFRGDQTYYLSATVGASVTTTFESGAVLKYAANASLNFYAPGTINWKAAPYRPCIFTAKDDNTVGENISGSTGNPAFGAYANPALNLLNYQGGTLSHFRVAYAQKAIAYHSVWLTFQDGQIVNCARGISFGQGVATVRNMLFANVQYAFSELGYCTISAEHVTFGGRDNYPYTPAFLAVPAVWSYPYGINLKNCIMARLNTFAQGSAATQTGEHNGFWKNSNPPFGTSPTVCPEGQNPFADGGAGDYYLAQDSPFRDVGWATVNPGLAEALRQRTTTTPILHANVTWNSDNLPDLSRRSIRDDDFMPNLGYHYEVLDYIFHDLQTSTTVRLEGGVAVGVQGSETGWGLRLQDGGHVECVGSPGNMNRIVSFQNVQELPPPVATTGYTARPGNVWLYHSGGTDATRRMVFRFTDIAVGQGCGGTVLSVAGVAPFAEVTFQDCRVRGGLVSVFLVQVNGPRNIRWVNNVWERAAPRVLYYAGSNPSPYHQHPVTLDCRNNLFRDSYLLLIYQAANGTAGIWEVKDNLFDQTANVATTDSAGAVLMQRSHNAATAGMVNNLGGTWYRTDLLRDYDVQGPLGEYYYPSSGGPYSMAQLRDAGSRSAADAGLAAYTTRADETPDTGTVDIGFHYPVAACNLLPLGFTINLETTPNGYLQIRSTAQTTPLPFVNVASSGRGTVARIEVPNPWNPSLPAARVAGEYYTTPGSLNNLHGTGSPSRTTVDRYGNVWVGNRDVGSAGYGSVTKIGVVIGGIRCNQDGTANDNGDYLKPDPALGGKFIYNTCIDRDGDGLIRTSPGRLANGSLRRLDWANESLPAGDGDEAVICYVRTTPTYLRSLAVDRDNNLWVGSRDDGWQELIDNATGVPVTGEKVLYGSGGYGAVFDPYGVLWSAGYYYPGAGLLWRPPGLSANVVPGTAGGILPDTREAYGIGIDPTTADVWLGDYTFGGLWQFRQDGCTNKFAFAAPDNPQGRHIKGIVGDGNGNIWVAHAKFESVPLGKVVYRFSNTGGYLGRVVLNYQALTGKSPHGVCIDSQKHIWAICNQASEDGKYYAMCIDPTQGIDPDTENIVGQVMDAVDLGAFPAGQGPYNYSDMSGFVTLAATQPAGVWNYVEDSATDHMRWLRVTLDSQLNSGVLFVEVRAANRVTDLPAWPFHRLNGSSGALSLEGLGIQGRYLEMRVTLLRNFGAAQGPLLKSLCITRGTAGLAFQITHHPKSAIVHRGGGPTVFSATATGTGLAYQWFKDGAPAGTGPTLTVNNAQYANAGKYKVRVTKSGTFQDSAEARLHVVSTPAPFGRPEVQVSNAEPNLGQSVTFAASMDISPSIGPVHYQWRKNGVPIPGAWGECTTSDDQNYAAGYTITSAACQHSGEYAVVFTNDYWKVASPVDDLSRVTVKDQFGNVVPAVTVTTSYPMPITDRDNPPTLIATACVTPVCAQWYRTDSQGGRYFKEPIPGANGMQYTLPNPVPCAMVTGYNYFMVEVFDEGRFPYTSTPVQVYGDCQP